MSELALEHPERVINLGSDARLGLLQRVPKLYLHGSWTYLQGSTNFRKMNSAEIDNSNGTHRTSSRPTIRIAVDCMGGDHGPSVILPACQEFLALTPNAELILVGRDQSLAPARDWSRCTIVNAEEVIEMNDSIEIALRRKKYSSMRIALSQLLEGNDGTGTPAQACVSAGNTGALMAVSRYVLKTLEGIERPALTADIPNSLGGYTTMLDLGANVDCSGETLLHFAVMGSSFFTAITGNKNPSVGLLSIPGAMTGVNAVTVADNLLRLAAGAGHVNYFGQVDGSDLFKGTTNVVVCDGFVGNVALKVVEGAATMFSGAVRDRFQHNIWTKLAATIALPSLNRLKARLDHRRYSGAALLGLRGLVFKSHGSSDTFAFSLALARAHTAAQNGMLENIQSRVDGALHRMHTSGM